MYYFSQKRLLFAKNADSSKTKGALVLKVTLSETTYVCVLTCQTSRFWRNCNRFWTGRREEGGGILPTPTHLKMNPLEANLD